jgi:hypothetical protein
MGQDFETRMRFGSKLGNEGGEKAIAVLLLHIPKIEIIVGHSGQSGRMHALDVLNDCGSNGQYE